jgi:hypothetical protein
LQSPIGRVQTTAHVLLQLIVMGRTAMTATVLIGASVLACAGEPPPQAEREQPELHRRGLLVTGNLPPTNSVLDFPETTFVVEDRNGVPGIQCGGSVGNSYTLGANNWVQVVTLLFTGVTVGQVPPLFKPHTWDCNSDVRHTLAAAGRVIPRIEFAAGSAIRD